MYLIKVAKKYSLCLILISCILLISCSANKRPEKIELFYKKYLEVTVMFEPLNGMNSLEKEEKQSEIVNELNSSDGELKQEELKTIIKEFSDSAKSEDDKRLAEVLENNYLSVIEVKEGAHKLPFDFKCIDILSMRKQAKEYIDAQK